MIRPEARLAAYAPALAGIAWRSLITIRTRSLGLFLSAFGGYVLVAVLLVFRGGVIVPDAWARVGNAAWMVIGRDPHLAAVGFVWNPLPSFAALPLVVLRGIWPPLVTAGFAANLISAIFMAGAVVVVARIAADLRVRRATAWILVGLFALHPMIVLYGANGMSEAPFIFFLLLAVRSLIAWWRTGSTHRLSAAAVAMALAYLTRYEALAAAAGALLAIGAWAYLGSPGSWRARRSWAAADLLVAGLPAGFAFGCWAVASWMITGNPFETFTSVYGNASQVALSGSSIAAVTGQGIDAWRYAFGQILGLSPALPIVGLVVVALAIWRRRWEIVVPVAIFGSVLAFAILATVGGASFAWLRFSIAAIPLSVVAALIAVAPMSRVSSPGASPIEKPVAPAKVARLAAAWRGSVGRSPARAGSMLLSLGIVALVAMSLPVSLSTMTDPHRGREEAGQVRAILGARADSTTATARQSEVGAAVARYLDGLELPDGSVVVDVAIGFPIVLNSSNPRQFVITPDRDFERILADPVAFGAKYMLAPAASGYASLDAVGRLYPGMFEDGAGFGRLVAEFGSDGLVWRLYQLPAA